MSRFCHLRLQLEGGAANSQHDVTRKRRTQYVARAHQLCWAPNSLHSARAHSTEGRRLDNGWRPHCMLIPRIDFCEMLSIAQSCRSSLAASYTELCLLPGSCRWQNEVERLGETTQ